MHHFNWEAWQPTRDPGPWNRRESSAGLRGLPPCVSVIASQGFLYTRTLTKCQFSLKPHLHLLLLFLFYSSQEFDSSAPVGPQGTQRLGNLSKIQHLVTVARTWSHTVRFQDTSLLGWPALQQPWTHIHAIPPTARTVRKVLGQQSCYRSWPFTLLFALLINTTHPETFSWSSFYLIIWFKDFIFLIQNASPTALQHRLLD